MSGLADNLLERGPLLLILLPLIGAILVVFVSRAGMDAVRRTALTNALLTGALALATVAHYDVRRAAIEGETLQMQSRLEWSMETGGHSDSEQLSVPLAIHVGVDGVGLWFVVLVAISALSAIGSNWNSEPRRGVALYALLLLAEAGAMGVFTAIDALWLCVCLAGLLAPLVLLVGLFGGSGRHTALRRIAGWHLASDLFVLFGVIGVAVTSVETTNGGPLTFSIPDLSERLGGLVGSGTAMERHWRLAAPVFFLPIVFGFAVKLPLVPFHLWMTGWPERTEVRGTLVVGLWPLGIGCFGFVRIAMPLFPELSASAAPVVVWFAAAGLLVVAAGISVRREETARTRFTILAAAALATAGLWSLQSAGVVGGLLTSLSVVAAGSLSLMWGDAAGRVSHADSLRPWMRTVSLVGLGGLICLPGLSGFPGAVATFAGLYATMPRAALAILLGFGWIVLHVTQSLFGRGKADSADENAEENEVPPSVLWSPLPLMLWVVVLGLCPQFFADRIEPSVRAADVAPAAVEGQ